MFSRQESAKIKKEFWTVFGQYMLPILSSDGEKVNWVNYRTGEKDIYFRLNADNKKATVAIELTHKDEEIRQIYFEQFMQFRNVLEQSVGEEWTWQLHAQDEHGKTFSRIFRDHENVNILKKEDWPELISFFKPRILALDEFWNHVKYGFETLR